MRGALRTRLTLQVVALIGVLAAAMWGGSNYTLRVISSGLADERADDVVNLLAASVSSALEFDDVRAMNDGLALLQATQNAAWAAVVHDDRVITARTLVAGFEPPAQLSSLDPDLWLVRRAHVPSPAGTSKADVVVVLSRAHELEAIDQALFVLATVITALGALGALLALVVALFLGQVRRR
jgi:hypothetical protein